jgi:signal transduction histidine kinase
VRVVKKNAERLIDMVTDILDVAKLEAGRMTLDRAPVDLGAIFEDVCADVKPLLENRKLQVQTLVSDRLQAPLADREALRRVVVNIVSNATAYSPRGGVITLEAAAGDAGVRVAITDQGPGVPPEDRGRIFDKFGSLAGRERGRKYSTGLGLAFCKLAVEAHGGEIGIDGEPGQGSTFWFTLPSDAHTPSAACTAAMVQEGA